MFLIDMFLIKKRVLNFRFSGIGARGIFDVVYVYSSEPNCRGGGWNFLENSSSRG